jgi:hypothetical protein
MIYYCHTEPEYAENDHPIGTKTVRLTREEVLERFFTRWSRTHITDARQLSGAQRLIVERACIHDWMIIQEGWIEKVKSSENIS